MINVKKGTAHSLQQSDLRGTATANIAAGMLCYISSTGATTATPATTYSNLGPRGFALNSSGDGDVIESGKIALYSLDGNSIIETDMVDLTGDSTTAISLTDYPLGTPIYASQAAAGKVSKLATGTPGAVIGWVEGVRFLQNATPYTISPLGGTSKAITQNATSATENAAYNAANAAGNTNLPTYTASTVSVTYKAQVNVPVLSIKLAAGI